MSRLPWGWQPRAVVFDCDGLLVDSEHCWTVAETEIFARRGLSFGPEQKASLIGKSLSAAAVVLSDAFDEPGNVSDIEAELLDLVIEAVSSTAEAMPGASELVSLVAGAVPMAIASNSPRVLLDAALCRAGFSDTFAVSLAADEVSEPKPSPEIYTLACRALATEPPATLAFEDSMAGVASARAAGVRIVGVPTLRHEEFPADLVVDSLLDSGLLDWVRGWPRLSMRSSDGAGLDGERDPGGRRERRGRRSTRSRP